MPETKKLKVTNGRVHGKERLGRLRGFGFVVTPSQVIGSANSYASSLPDPRMEIEYLRLQLQIRDEQVQALEAGLQTTDAKLESVNQKVQSLQRQMSYLIQYLGIQIPPSTENTQETQAADKDLEST
ncbi:hypothetical protein ACFE04_027747 [Oxalis oulophora]